VFIVRTLGDFIIDQIMRGDSPSKICNSLSVFRCNGCSLSGNSANPDPALQAYAKAGDAKFGMSKINIPPILWSLGNPRILPTLDNDKDYFSPTDTLLRSAHWRGRDCNDKNPNIKPGVVDNSADSDMDCNGISGKDDQGRLYEDLYCKDSKAKQIIIFGDSATSAFHIPSDWLFFRNMTNVIPALQNELDWPQNSWGTGYDPAIQGKSVYSYMRERNRCVHRQYQNIGYNGGSMRDFPQQILGLSMDPSQKPFLAFASYIGNDVCKRSLEQMTKPDVYLTHMTRALNELDAKAPKGSRVIVTGMVDGTILFKEMGHRTHPFGVPYVNVYNFLDCTDANPCKTWLTSNNTQRQLATDRAMELSRASEKWLAENGKKFKNIEAYYIDFPLEAALEESRRRGMSPHLLIEAVDGFHSSHEGHKMFAEFEWKYILEKHADWLGPVNPHNDAIKAKFGEQGGH
jgi:acyloxyacyl hydrolase